MCLSVQKLPTNAKEDFSVLQLVCSQCDLTERGCVALVYGCVCMFALAQCALPGAESQMGEGKQKEFKGSLRQERI